MAAAKYFSENEYTPPTIVKTDDKGPKILPVESKPDTENIDDNDHDNDHDNDSETKDEVDGDEG